MRRRPVRMFDVATSLYYYLMIASLAGTNAYAAIGKQSDYKLPPLEQVVRDANAQVKSYEGRIANAGAPTPEELEEALTAQDKALLQRLDAIDTLLRGEKADPQQWDRAIKVAEDVRRRGEVLAKSAEEAEVKVGWHLAARGARTHARIAQLISSVPGAYGWDTVMSPIIFGIGP